MTISKDHIKIGLIAIVSIILLVFVMTMLRRKTETPKEYKQLIEAYDKIIAAKDETIQLRKEMNESLSVQIRSHQQKDSLLLIQLITNQPKYTANEKMYNDIPVRVSNLTVDELKREFSNY